MPDQFIGNVRIESRADTLDREQMRDLERGRAWEMIAAKIRAMIAERQGDLERSGVHDDLMRAQGAVAALRRVLELPKIIRAEVKAEDRDK